MQQGSDVELPDIDLTEPTVEETAAPSAPNLRRVLVIGLYESEHDVLVRWARLLATSDAAAEQLVRDAFVKFYGSLHDPVMPDDADRRVRRALFDVARSGTRRNTPQRWQNDVIAPAENATPVDVGELLVRGVHQLAPRQRECIVLRHYGRLSDSQVARELGATLGSTRTHLRRATARLDGLVATLAGEDAELRMVLPLAFDAYAYAPRPVGEPDVAKLVAKLVAMLERHDRLKTMRRAVVAGGALLLALFFAMRAGVGHDVGMHNKPRPERQPDKTLPLPVAPKPVGGGNANAPTGHTGNVPQNTPSSPNVGSAKSSGTGAASAASSGSQSSGGTGTQSSGNQPVTVGPVAAQQGFWAAGSENSGPSGRQRWQIFGQAPVGATITMSSQWGNAQTTATAAGYSAIVEIRNAPKGVNFPLTVSCSGCGDVTLQVYKYTNPAQPLDETTLSETEPVQLNSTSGSGFIVGGFVPQGASVVTLTTSYGVRTFQVSGNVWGGFIDFSNVAHGASFKASITSDATSSPLEVTLTRP